MSLVHFLITNRYFKNRISKYINSYFIYIINIILTYMDSCIKWLVYDYFDKRFITLMYTVQSNLPRPRHLYLIRTYCTSVRVDGQYVHGSCKRLRAAHIWARTQRHQRPARELLRERDLFRCRHRLCLDIRCVCKLY